MTIVLAEVTDAARPGSSNGARISEQDPSADVAIGGYIWCTVELESLRSLARSIKLPRNARNEDVAALRVSTRVSEAVHPA